jgi:transposase
MFYVGMDIHKYFSQVAVVDESGEVIQRRRLNHTPSEEVTNYFNQFPKDTQVIMEPTCGWGWLSDDISDLGLEVILAHPSKVRLIAESWIKTDKVDALALAQLQRTSFLPQAYLAPKDVRQLRDLFRCRCGLVRLRTILKLRIHALLDRLGIFHHFSDLFGKTGRAFLDNLSLESPYRENLDRQLRVIDLLTKEIGQIEKVIQKRVQKDPQAKRLTTIPGIGFILAYMITSEIGEISRFRSAKKLASYCGLVPSVKQSGSFARYGHLTKSGNTLLRWGFIEAAQVAIRYNPELKIWADKIRRKKGAGVAIGAVARKLVNIVYQLLTQKRDYRPREIEINRSSRPVRPLVAPPLAG